MERKAAVIDSTSGKVLNLIVFSGETGLKGLTFPNEAVVLECTDYPVTVGDTFDGEQFLREGVPVERLVSDSEKILSLQEQLEATQAVLDEMLLGGV